MKNYILIIVAISTLLSCTSAQIRIEDVKAPARPAKGDGYIFIDYLKHESNHFYLRDNSHNNVEFILEVRRDDVEKITLVFEGRSYEMESIGVLGELEYFRVVVNDIDEGEYYFKLEDGRFTYYYGVGGGYSLDQITKLQYQSSNLVRRDIMKNEIWYYIYVDGFKNGDKDNDPIFNEFGPRYFLPARGNLSSGTAKRDLVEAWGDRRDEYNLGNFVLNNWQDDFNRINIWESRAEQLYPWSKSSTKRFGGDIKGIIEKLDYLEELGVTALWLSPVFYSYSGSKYDIIDYRHISPDYGVIEDRQGRSEYKLLKMQDSERNYLGESLNPETWVVTESDKIFRDFIGELKKRDMKLMLDVNFEYVSSKFFAFEALLMEGPNSKYLDWFFIDNWEDIDYEDIDSWNPLLDYAGSSSIGVEYIDGKRKRRSFIKVQESHNNLERREIIKWNKKNIGYRSYNGNKNLLILNLENEELKRYIFNALLKWVEFGLDAYKIEVNSENMSFYRELEEYIYGKNEDVQLVYNIDINKRGEVQGSYLDYYLASGLYSYLAENNKNYSYSNKELAVYLKLFKGTNSINLLESIDTDRFISSLINPNRDFDRLNNQDREGYLGIRPALFDKNVSSKLKLASIAQYTLPGAPMIYYGSERGMWGGDTPHNRKAMLWEEYLPYSMESDNIEKYSDYRGKLTESVIYDEVAKRIRYNVSIDAELEEHYRRLNRVYMENIELFVNGTFELIETDSRLFIYKRVYEGEVAIIALNNTGSTITVEQEVEQGRSYLNPISEQKIDVIAGSVELRVEARSGIILIKN